MLAQKLSCSGDVCAGKRARKGWDKGLWKSCGVLDLLDNPISQLVTSVSVNAAFWTVGQELVLYFYSNWVCIYILATPELYQRFPVQPTGWKKYRCWGTVVQWWLSQQEWENLILVLCVPKGCFFPLSLGTGLTWLWLSSVAAESQLLRPDHPLWFALSEQNTSMELDLSSECFREGSASSLLLQQLYFTSASSEAPGAAEAQMKSTVQYSGSMQ